MTSLTREEAFSRLVRWCDEDQHLTLVAIFNSQPRRLPARVRNFSLEQDKILLEVMVDGAPQLWRVCLTSAAFSGSNAPGGRASDLQIELLPGPNRYVFTETQTVTTFRRARPQVKAIAAGASKIPER